MLLARGIWGRWSWVSRGSGWSRSTSTTASSSWPWRPPNDMVGCPGCGAVAWAHGRRPVRVRDLPVGGRPTTLIWIKRLWRCRYQRCEIRTWSETSPRDRAAGLADDPGGAAGLPAGRPRRRVGRGRGLGLRGGVGDGDARGLRARHPAGRRPRPAGRGGRARGRRDRLPRRDREPPHRVRHRPGRPHPHAAVRPGCSTSCLVAAARCSRAGCAGGTSDGAQRWRSRRWTRSAGTPPRCAPTCPPRCGCSTRSTW